MQQGEVLVALLGKGATVVRYHDETASRVTVALGRNKQARIPHNRIVLASGVLLPDQERFEEFRAGAQEQSAEIDLAEVWELVSIDGETVSLYDLAGLYWTSTPDPAGLVALALGLDQDTDRFVRGPDGYTPRSPEELDELLARRQREADNANEAELLVSGLVAGTLPAPLTHHQEGLLRVLKDFVIQGEEYPRSPTARALLELTAPGTGDLERYCFDILVRAGVFSLDEPLELHRIGVSGHFAEDAVAEAAAIDLGHHLARPSRRDLTGLTIFTIDDEGTEDRDDALSVEVLDGGVRVGVHIADAGSLITIGGAVDREADRRMATLYVPDGKIDMLPSGVAKGVGSLDPEQDRCALSMFVTVDASGETSHMEVVPSVIRTAAALSYEDADRAIEDNTGSWASPLTQLQVAGDALRARREAAGAINIEQPEMVVAVSATGEAAVRVLERSSPSRRLVTELMVLCNSRLAEYCRDNELPAIFRSQEPPDLERVGLSSPEIPEGMSEVLHRFLLTRSFFPAQVDTVARPHSGLGVAAYLQATSPLRRFPDLVVQRQISSFLAEGEPIYDAEAVGSVSARAALQLRELAQAEGARKRYWFLKFLQQSRMEGLFEATVLDNQPRRLAMLDLSEYPFRTRSEIPQEEVPGDVVTLKLQGIDLWRRVGHFVHVPGGAYGSEGSP
jgi:exoribonuclease-2